MKNILIFVFLLSFIGLVKGQLCPNLNVYNQNDLDSWVAANGGTCNKLESLTLSQNLDYSGLTFIDTISGSLMISNGTFSMDGFQKIAHVGSLIIYGFGSGTDIPDMQLLDLKSVQAYISITGATIPDLVFMDDLITIPNGLLFKSNSFTNSGNLLLPKLKQVGALGLGENSGITDLSFFSNLNKASSVILNGTKLTTIQPLKFIDTIYSLSLEENLQLNNVDFQDINMLEKLYLKSGNVTNITNLNIDTLKILI